VKASVREIGSLSASGQTRAIASRSIINPVPQTLNPWKRSAQSIKVTRSLIRFVSEKHVDTLSPERTPNRLGNRIKASVPHHFQRLGKLKRGSNYGSF
jgi:hypothetical protein